jgi:hypothetical protein
MGRFISVTRVGDAAGVQLSWKRGSDEYIDFHNLLRIKGVWKITNKTALVSNLSHGITGGQNQEWQPPRS